MRRQVPEQAACAVVGCERPTIARGWCRTHYMRWSRHGTVEDAPKPEPKTCAHPGCDKIGRAKGRCSTHYRWLTKGEPANLTTTERFWAKVDKSTECWVWTGSIDRDGYGSVTIDRQTRKAHRVSAWLAGMLTALDDPGWICHHCDNPICVRPEHLYLGNVQSNNQDVVMRGRRAGERNPAARLTEEQVREIRAAYKPGVVTQQMLADRVQVSPGTVEKIVYRRSWKYL